MLALIISIGAGYFFSLQSEDYSAVNVQRPRSQESPPLESPSNNLSVPDKPASDKPAQDKPAEIVPIPQQTGALNALDLSLGNFSIDDPENKVRQVLGTPLKTSNDSDGTTRLTYDAIEVVLRNGKISALVSQTSAVSTPRGIHDGSIVQEVFDAYGTNYQSSSFDGKTLYEYTITSKNGTPCWLRFAVRNEDGRVDYISARYVQ